VTQHKLTPSFAPPPSLPLVVGPSSRLAVTAGLVFVQMLPATLVAPAIRPLFAAFHPGREGAMHAFMAVNMLGAAVAAPLLGAWSDRRGRPRELLPVVALVDALLLFLLAAPLPTAVVLALRTLEGAAHVGGMTLLLAEVATLRRRSGGAAMGWAGGAIMLAVAAGSALGGLMVAADPRAPFWVGAGLAALLAAAAPLLPVTPAGDAPVPVRHGLAAAVRETLPSVRLPVAAAFVGRFTVGCIVVTFALFAHRAHGLSDRAIGGLFSAFTLPFALMMVPAERLARSVPRSVLLASGLAAHGVAIASLGWVPTSLLPVAMASAGTAAAFVFAPTLAYAAELAPVERRSSAMALVGGAGCLGMLLGPTVAGITSALARTADPAHAPRAVFLVAAASHLVLLVLARGWLTRRLRAERGRETT
jgi:MFS family permease